MIHLNTSSLFVNPAVTCILLCNMDDVCIISFKIRCQCHQNTFYTCRLNFAAKKICLCNKVLSMNGE